MFRKDIKKLFEIESDARGSLITIVLPLYNEEDSLPLLFDELFSYLSINLLNYKFEILFIDDCSTDNSFNVVVNYSRVSPTNIKICVLRLAKNSGSHIAITAGINYSRGDFTIIMASDNQDPPHIIGELIYDWELGYDLILAARKDNLDHSSINKFFSVIAWKIMNWSTNVNMPEKGCDLLGMDKKVVIAYNKMDERNTTFIYRLLSLGFKQKNIEYVKRVRTMGVSKWTLLKKFSIMLDAITGFSNKPLKLISNLGILLFIVLVFRWIYIVFNIYILGKPIDDLTIILNTLFTTFAILILTLGFIGDYIWRVLDETRKRPVYEINDVGGEVFD